MIRRDWAEVLKIEAGTRDEWDAADLEHWITQKSVIGMVFEGERDRVVGHMVYSLQPQAMVVLRINGSAEAVAALIERIKAKVLQSPHRRTVEYCACEMDDNQIPLFASAGFKAELAPGAFGSRDGYLFRYSVDESENSVESEKLSD